jgi:broad specificity phosphatase PhoE
MKMELWLIRHGVTDANLEGRIQGRLDFPLSLSGKKEVCLLAKRLRNQSFYAFFSSNLSRAKETSQMIASQIRTPPPVYSPLLQEYDWGIIQGLTRKEIGDRYPLLLSQLERDFHHAEVPGAEGMQSLFRRVKGFYRFLSASEKRNTKSLPVIVVSHGRFLQAFMLYFLGYDPGKNWPFSFSPASLTILDGDFKKSKRIRLFNDTCHL